MTRDIAAYRSSVEQTIDRYHAGVEKLLCRLGETGHSEDRYDLIAALAAQNEHLASRLREELILLFVRLRNQGLAPCLRELPEASDVEITEHGGVYRIRLDGMLPFSSKSGVKHLHTKLDHALERYRQENDLRAPIFDRRCAVVLLHHYEKERVEKRQIYDYDNLDRSCVLNVVARHFLLSDDPTGYLLCESMVCGEKTYTEIMVMGLDSFRGMTEAMR